MIQQGSKKVVIFDLGNVVLDWNIESILESLKLPKSDLKLLREELFLHQDWIDMDLGERSESAVVSRVCNRTHIRQNVIENALLVAKESLKPIPESIFLMQEIRDFGIQMYCLSNMSFETFNHIKEQEFFNMFTGIVISGIEKCMKPNKEIFHLTLNRFELTPAETFFIDDSLHNINSAHELGMNCFHFKRSKKCYSEIRRLIF